jgi:peptidoglycan/xylan/chitin deacetylase (PgdA/CDA1 family)
VLINLRKDLDFSLSKTSRRATELSASFVSQVSHYFTLGLKKPRMQFEKAMLIMSIDVDVGSRELGQINKGKNDANVNRRLSEYKIGEIEERALILFVDLFSAFEIPVTFAIRGQLIETDSIILKLILESHAKHDIGAHGYYHRRFQNLSREEAENELNMISVGMKKVGIIPRSFVFPGNSVSYLHLLEKFGYECFRSAGNLLYDAMCIEEKGRLYDIRPSLCLYQSVNAIMLRKILDVAIAKKAPLHIWFHPWNFGETKESIKKNITNVFVPFLDYAETKEKGGVLTFETMLSAAKKAGKILAVKQTIS